MEEINMITIIKEKLVKWSRKAEKLEKISKFFAYAILISLIPLVLCDIGFKLFPEYIYSALWIILGVALIVGICIKTAESVLNAVKRNKDNIYKNKLLNILLSEEDVVWSIICILFLITIVVVYDFKIWLYILWLILLYILPRKVANYFKEKLLK